MKLRRASTNWVKLPEAQLTHEAMPAWGVLLRRATSLCVAYGVRSMIN
jgi:hypothetical protein